MSSEQPHQGKKLSPDIYKNHWGAQTHIDEDFNSLVNLENSVLLLGKEAQNLKLQIHLMWPLASTVRYSAAWPLPCCVQFLRHR